MKVLIHNLGGSDLELLEPWRGLIPTGKELPDRAYRSMLQMACADYHTAAKVEFHDTTRPICLATANGAVRMQSRRLQGYLYCCRPDRVILNVTQPTSEEDETDTEWMAPVFRRWLGECFGYCSEQVVVQPYEAKPFFENGATGYSAIRSHLQSYLADEQYRGAEWYVTLTGGLPQMNTPLALLAAELLVPRVTVLTAARPPVGALPRVRPSQLLSILRLSQVTHLVEAFDYAAALTLARGFLPETDAGKAALALLEYGACRADHRVKNAATFLRTSRSGPIARLYSNEETDLAQLEAEHGAHETGLGLPNPGAAGCCRMRLREQIWILDCLARRRDTRSLVAQLEVFTTWVLIEYLCLHDNADFNAYGRMDLAALKAVTPRPCTPTTDPWDLAQAPPLETQIANGRGFGSGPTYTANLNALGRYCEWVARRQCRQGPDLREQVERLYRATVTDHTRGLAAHNLVGIGVKGLADRIRPAGTAPSVGAEPWEALGRDLEQLTRSAYRTVFAENSDLPALDVDSPYSRLNDAWRSLVNEIVAEAEPPPGAS